MKTCDWVFNIPANKPKNWGPQEVIFRRIERVGMDDTFLSFIFNPPQVFPAVRKEYKNEGAWREDMGPFDKMAVRCPAIKTYKESERK